MTCSTVRAASCSARPTTACSSRWQCSTECSKETLSDHASDRPGNRHSRAEERRPYIRMYKGKTFVIKAGAVSLAIPH